MPESPSKLATLRQLLAERFPTASRHSGGCVPTGVPAIDEALGGGLPGGLLTEVVSAGPGTGGQFLLAWLLAATRASRLRAALIDAADGFAPETVPEDELRHLVWVRPRGLEQAFGAADILARDGNYAVVALDLRGLPEKALRRQPAAAWFRLQRAVEGGAAALLVQTEFPLVPSAPWRLVLREAPGLESRWLERDELAAGLRPEVERSRSAATEEKAG